MVMVVTTLFILAPIFADLIALVTSFSTNHPTICTSKLRLQAEEMSNDASVRIPDWIQTAIDDTETIAAPITHPEKSPTYETKFFLVDTKHPGNVGSSARSLKTMGFFPEGLVVVTPRDDRVLRRKRCIDAASGAKDVLEHAVLVVDEESKEKDLNSHDETATSSSRCLEQAILKAFGSGPVLVCGTGMPADMRHERGSRKYMEPRKLFTNLLGGSTTIKDHLNESIKAPATTTAPTVPPLKIAFVFGNERYGMAPEDMDICNVILGIPTHSSFGSLNLATAVQIVAYDWRQAMGGF